MSQQPNPDGYDARPSDVGATPALDLLLKRGWAESPELVLDVGTPFECTYCPFSSKSVERYEEIWNDISEAHYVCSLLERVVWGEEAPCELADWQARARNEVDAHGTQCSAEGSGT